MAESPPIGYEMTIDPSQYLEGVEEANRALDRLEEGYEKVRRSSIRALQDILLNTVSASEETRKHVEQVSELANRYLDVSASVWKIQQALSATKEMGDAVWASSKFASPASLGLLDDAALATRNLGGRMLGAARGLVPSYGAAAGAGAVGATALGVGVVGGAMAYGGYKLLQMQSARIAEDAEVGDPLHEAYTKTMRQILTDTGAVSSDARFESTREFLARTDRASSMSLGEVGDVYVASSLRGAVNEDAINAFNFSDMETRRRILRMTRDGRGDEDITSSITNYLHMAPRESANEMARRAALFKNFGGYDSDEALGEAAQMFGPNALKIEDLTEALFYSEGNEGRARRFVGAARRNISMSEVMQVAEMAQAGLIKDATGQNLPAVEGSLSEIADRIVSGRASGGVMSAFGTDTRNLLEQHSEAIVSMTDLASPNGKRALEQLGNRFGNMLDSNAVDRANAANAQENIRMDRSRQGREVETRNRVLESMLEQRLPKSWAEGLAEWFRPYQEKAEGLKQQFSPRDGGSPFDFWGQLKSIGATSPLGMLGRATGLTPSTPYGQGGKNASANQAANRATQTQNVNITITTEDGISAHSNPGSVVN